MMDLVWMSVVLGAFAGVFLAAASARRSLGVAAETSRKIVHVGMGLVSLALPWIFADVRPVAALGLIACGGLVAVRAWAPLRAAFGGVLHGVARRSFGEFTFTLGVVLVFAIGHTHPLAYCTAIAVLTVADTAAAIIGGRFGRLRSVGLGEGKSVEGSLACFVAAFACVVVVLVTKHANPAAVLEIALAVASGATILEAWAARGFDNLMIPLGAYTIFAGLYR